MPEIQGLDFNLTAVGTEVNEPDPGGTSEFIRRIHYRLEDSLADLVDNSIDASAKHVHIRLFRNAIKFQRITVSDDGHGMDLSSLQLAMKYGGQRQHRPSDLGKYGAGMKTASFNQCKSLSVVTQQHGEVYARRWTLPSIKSGWECEVIDSKEAARVFNQSVVGLKVRDHGTVIIWEKLDCLQVAPSEIDRLTSRLLPQLSNALGLCFHRFLGTRSLSLTLDVVNTEMSEEPLRVDVAPLDPFGYSKTGAKGYPVTFQVEISGGHRLDLESHIWPPKSEDIGYKLGGGQVAARQGFYVYRNKRVIQAGGWLGLRANDTEPHSSLARVCVDMPSSMDSVFGLSVQKSNVKAPPEFKDAVENAQTGNTKWADYLRAADLAYRDGRKKVAEKTSNVVPGAGISARLQAKLGRILAPEHTSYREVSFEWMKLAPSSFFKVDDRNDRIFLNKSYRHKILGAASATSTDAPLIKMLIFSLLRGQFDNSRRSSKQKQLRTTLNAMIVQILNLTE